mgnify:CR=1 FL=1
MPRRPTHGSPTHTRALDRSQLFVSETYLVQVGCSVSVQVARADERLRAAMLKLKDDKRTTIDLKIHEICLLLIFGPAGVKMKKKQEAFVAPLSGVERRAVLASAAKM